MINIALFTGAIFVCASIVVNRCYAFLRLFLYLLSTSPTEVRNFIGQMTEKLVRIGTLWYAMKQIWRTKKRIKMASNIDIQKDTTLFNADAPK